MLMSKSVAFAAAHMMVMMCRGVLERERFDDAMDSFLILLYFEKKLSVRSPL